MEDTFPFMTSSSFADSQHIDSWSQDFDVLPHDSPSEASNSQEEEEDCVESSAASQTP